MWESAGDEPETRARALEGEAKKPAEKAKPKSPSFAKLGDGPLRDDRTRVDNWSPLSFVLIATVGPMFFACVAKSVEVWARPVGFWGLGGVLGGALERPFRPVLDMSISNSIGELLWPPNKSGS